METDFTKWSRNDRTVFEKAVAELNENHPKAKEPYRIVWGRGSVGDEQDYLPDEYQSQEALLEGWGRRITVEILNREMASSSVRPFNPSIVMPHDIPQHPIVVSLAPNTICTPQSQSVNTLNKSRGVNGNGMGSANAMFSLA